MSNAISEELLKIIVCPDCHGELVLSSTSRAGLRDQGGSASAPADPSRPAAGSPDVPELACQGCGLVYPVRDGIPVLLVDEARSPR